MLVLNSKTNSDWYYFEDPDTTKSKHPWKVRLNRIKLNRTDFSFADLNDKSKVYGVDFEDIHLKNSVCMIKLMKKCQTFSYENENFYIQIIINFFYI